MSSTPLASRARHTTPTNSAMYCEASPRPGGDVGVGRDAGFAHPRYHPMTSAAPERFFDQPAAVQNDNRRVALSKQQFSPRT